MFVARTGVFAVVGVLLSGPLLMAFFDFLMVANVGAHDGQGSPVGLRRPYAAMIFLPYLSGSLLRNPADFWENVGGYSGIALFVPAMVGATGRLYRGIRLFLLFWTPLALGAMFSIQPILAFLDMVPGLDKVAIYRYIVPSLLFALVTLASLALDDLWRDSLAINRMRYALMGVIAAAACLSMVAVAHGLRPAFLPELAAVLLQLGLVAVLAAVLFWKGVHLPQRSRWIAAIGALEIIALFAVPMINYPMKRDLELGSVRFLQRNLGLQRFVATGPIALPGVMAANYGSYFGIAQVNWNDLPVPQAWVDYVQRHIDPHADPIVFRASPKQFIKTVPAYAAIGTRYVTVPRVTPLPGLTPAFEDAMTRVYELPGVRSYFTAENCRVVAGDRLRVTTSCARPSRLERLELFMPGWAATINGRPAPVRPVGEIFQAVAVPAGVATTQFVFVPPGLGYGLLAAAFGVVLLAAALAIDWRSRPTRAGDPIVTA